MIGIESETCKVKKKGKFLLVKDAVIVVEKEGELPYEINANTFFKRYSKTYPDSGPEATVAFAGQEIAEIAELVDLEFNKKNKQTKLRFRVAKDDRAGGRFLDALWELQAAKKVLEDQH